MKRLIFTPALLVIGACSSAAEKKHGQLIAQIEQRVQLPAGAERLARYARYYAINGNRVVATYTTFVDPQVEHVSLATGHTRWIDDYRRMPLISDGGCSVVNVLYDPSKQKVEHVFCNGVA